jgi:hypothetical protein
MEGLKVVGTGRSDAPNQCASGYSFAELFAPIQWDTHDLYWALEGSVVLVAAAGGVVSPDDEVLDAMFEVSPGVPPPPRDYQPVWERGWLSPIRTQGAAGQRLLIESRAATGTMSQWS